MICFAFCVCYVLDIPMPYASNLEALATPQVTDIVDMAIKLTERPGKN